MRYLIASQLPCAIADQIRTHYPTCSVRMLHTTLIPPFACKYPQTIHDYLLAQPIPHIMCHFGQPDRFTHPDRTILYLPLVPSKPLETLFNTIYTALKSHLTLETKLLPFLPHVTLNYHAIPPFPTTVPEIESFPLPAPQLFIETAQGIWQPYST